MGSNFLYDGLLDSNALFIAILEHTFHQGVTEDDITIINIRDMTEEEEIILPNQYNTAIEVLAKDGSVKINPNKNNAFIFYCERQALSKIKNASLLEISPSDVNFNEINKSLIDYLNNYSANKTTFAERDLIIEDRNHQVSYDVSLKNNVNVGAKGGITINIAKVDNNYATFELDKNAITVNNNESINVTYTLMDPDNSPLENQRVTLSCTTGSLSQVNELGNGIYACTYTADLVESPLPEGSGAISVAEINNQPAMHEHVTTVILKRKYVSITTSNGATVSDSEVLSALMNNESISYSSANGRWLEKITLPKNGQKGRAVKITVTSTWGTTVSINGAEEKLNSGAWVYVFDGSGWTKNTL